MKTCTKCHQEKSLSDFHKDKSGMYGHKAKCKKCSNEARKQWRIRRNSVIIPEDDFLEFQKAYGFGRRPW